MFFARLQELALSRGTSQLLKDHGPFTHLRKASTTPMKASKQHSKEAAKDIKGVAKDGSKEGSKDKSQERIVYTDASGAQFEVTADRKRKLQAILGAYT